MIAQRSFRDCLGEMNGDCQGTAIASAIEGKMAALLPPLYKAYSLKNSDNLAGA